MRKAEDFRERFWKFVHKTPNCWFWIGSRVKEGYGRFKVNRGTRIATPAHRVAWFLTKGFWPNKNLLHDCDIPQCVRPDHLFEGTHKDNAEDAAKKGFTSRLTEHLKTRCIRGHLRIPGNTYISPKGHRQCRPCLQWRRQRRSVK